MPLAHVPFAKKPKEDELFLKKAKKILDDLINKQRKASDKKNEAEETELANFIAYFVWVAETAKESLNSVWKEVKGFIKEGRYSAVSTLGKEFKIPEPGDKEKKFSENAGSFKEVADKIIDDLKEMFFQAVKDYTNAKQKLDKKFDDMYKGLEKNCKDKNIKIPAKEMIVGKLFDMAIRYGGRIIPLAQNAMSVIDKEIKQDLDKDEWFNGVEKDAKQFVKALFNPRDLKQIFEHHRTIEGHKNRIDSIFKKFEDIGKILSPEALKTQDSALAKAVENLKTPPQKQSKQDKENNASSSPSLTPPTGTGS